MQLIANAEIDARAAETSRWCSGLLQTSAASLSGRYRSQALRPRDIAMRGARLQGLSEDNIHRERGGVVEKLVADRAKLLESIGDARPMVGGELLTFDVDASFYDGVAAVETHGFFDEEDLPPWDTWVAYGVVKNLAPRLISWVPQEHVKLVERAVAVHVCDAYAWLREVR